MQRVLTDNGSAYKSHAWRNLLRDNNITHKRTHFYRPQTNGKVARLNRTVLDEWAYADPYQTAHARRQTFTTWLHYYNHHRASTRDDDNAASGQIRPLKTASDTSP